MIPKVIHRIWFGPHAMPDEYVEYGRLWESFGYETCLWSESNLPALVNQHVYDVIPERGVDAAADTRGLGVWVQRADVVGYELVWRFGGIYANCDLEPLKPLDDLLDGVEAFAAREDAHSVCNALMGGTPRHPFWRAVIDALPGRFDDCNNWCMQLQTGPGLLTDVAGRRDDVTIFPPERFYPYPFGDAAAKQGRYDFPDAYTIHRWGHVTWRPPSQ